MFDGNFVFHFPLFAICRYTAAELANDSTLKQKYVIVESARHNALCLFTEQDLAEEFRICEMIAGNVISLNTPFSLVEFLLQRDPSIADVCFDPNAAAGKIVGCSVTAVIDALGPMIERR